MPFIAIPNTTELVVQGLSDGQLVLNVFAYKWSGTTPSDATLLSFISAWLTAFQTEFLALHGANYTLQQLTARNLDVPAGNTATQTVSGPGNTGTQAGNALPNNVAASLSWRTGIVGRRNRGRSYIGGLAASAINNDTYSSAFLTALSTFATHIISLTVSAIFDFAVASVADHLSKVITGAVINTTSDSQRRRLPGRGI